MGYEGGRCCGAVRGRGRHRRRRSGPDRPRARFRVPADDRGGFRRRAPHRGYPDRGHASIADGACGGHRLPSRRVQCRSRRLLLSWRHRGGGRRLQSNGLDQSAAHSLRSRLRIACRRRVAAGARPPARMARGQRGRHNADAELHRDRPDELARRRTAPCARIRQLRHPADHLRRRVAASPAADHAQPWFSHQPRAGGRVWRLDPLLCRRIPLPNSLDSIRVSAAPSASRCQRYFSA